MEHYILRYWRELLRRAWRDARHFESHVWWELALLAVFVLVAPSAVVIVLHWKDGLVTLLASIAVILLWYLVFVSPARMHRDARAKISALEAAKISDLAGRPNLSVEFSESLAQFTVINTGSMANALDVRVKDEFLKQMKFLEGSGIRLHSGSSHTFLIASVGLSKGGLVLRWNIHLAEGTYAADVSTGQKVSLLLLLTSHPENQTGPIQWRLTFHSSGWEKEKIAPLALSRLAGPPPPTAFG